MVKFLIRHGAIPTVKDFCGDSPLNAAFRGNHLEVVDLLSQYDDAGSADRSNTPRLNNRRANGSSMK